jgi:uncharacterized OsmC-like protein
MDQLTTATPRPADAAADQKMDVRHVDGDCFEVTVRGHHMLVDQPVDAPTPTELFVASLATCVAFYAGRYLTRHGLDPEGLEVQVAFQMAADRPPRVAGVQLIVKAPDSLPAERRAALLAVVSHCTVHNTLTQPPTVAIDVA